MTTIYNLPKKVVYFSHLNKKLHLIFLEADDEDCLEKIDSVRAKLAEKHNINIEEIGVVVK